MPPKPETAVAKRIREFLSTSGLKWKESTASYKFTCPRCGKDEKLWMFKETGRFICFYCAEVDGFKGRPEYALAELAGVSINDVRKDIYGDETPPATLFLDVELEDWWSVDEVKEEVPDLTKFPVTLWGPDCLPIEHRGAARGVEYLARRGVDLELAKRYDIHYNAMQKRVLIPIKYHGRLYGWQGRYIDVTEVAAPDGRVVQIPKVLTTPEGLKKGQMLMYADQLDGAKHAIVTEGPFDGIKCDGCHEPDEKAGNVVTMGKGVSEWQIMLLKYSGVRRVYLGLDPDAATSTERLVQALAGDVEVYLMEPPSGYGDLGDMPVEGVTEVWRDAKPAMLGATYIYLNPENTFFKLPRYRRARQGDFRRK